jgi:hypothetical protein
MFKITLEFIYKDAGTAERMLSSLKLDNEGYVESRVEDNRLVSVIKAEKLSSLRQTLEDFLACAQLAENVMLGGSGEPPNAGGGLLANDAHDGASEGPNDEEEEESD